MAKAGSNKLKPWVFEIAAMAASIALLISMASLLLAYHEKPIFDDKLITLNAIVSILSTASKATLMTTVASCISQGNWVLFSGKPRRLYDFEMISEASRGPWGSLMVLWSRSLHGGLLIRLGAIATILTLAMDPFAQQLVQLKQIFKRESGAAVIPYASRYSAGLRMGAIMVASIVTDDGRVELFDDLYVNSNADFAMQAAITYGLTADSATLVQQFPFNCSAQDCEAKPLVSLAVCSRCSNITSHLSKNNKSTGSQFSELQFDGSSARAKSGCTEYRLPNNLTLNNLDDEYGPNNTMVYMTMRGTSNTSDTVTMSDIDTLIWSQSIIKVDKAVPDLESNKKWPNFEVHASECALYYCAKTYNVKKKGGAVWFNSTELKGVKRNQNSWAPLDSKFENVSKTILNSLAYHPKGSYITRGDLQLIHDDDTKWNISQEAVEGISYYAQNFFAYCLNRENCTEALEDWDVPNGFYISTWPHPALDDRDKKVMKPAEQYRPSSAKTLWKMELDSTFETIAESMSNTLREDADGDSVVRTADLLKPITVYTVVWPWIILHCITELGALVLLILTIRSTNRKTGAVPVWKSSQLAVLAKGMVVGDVFKQAHTTEQLGERAKTVPVVLVSRIEDSRISATENIPMVTREPRSWETETQSLNTANRSYTRVTLDDDDERAQPQERWL
ncbi:hypothetical protein FSARC_3256 [Fusarium sarcochroum]|uniref:Uncharacterized protein n=1 Tax=Fusarium sarcochroum TaxID=1208366 RepID=A0A8H4XCU1_9HYPO|nr:hypothetical protein FSARC_3256 [Fusarium sarcochroum]